MRLQGVELLLLVVVLMEVGLMAEQQSKGLLAKRGQGRGGGGQGIDGRERKLGVHGEGRVDGAAIEAEKG